MKESDREAGAIDVTLLARSDDLELLHLLVGGTVKRRNALKSDVIGNAG